MDGSTINLNQNAVECIRSTSDFGAYTVHNICTGAVNSVPWGAVEWALCVGAVTGAVVFLLLFGAMALDILFH